MAIERRNPLPAGRYWIDVFDPKRNDFRVWLSQHKDQITIEQTKEYLAEHGTWYLFTTHEDIQWDGPGFPTIATEEVHTQADTGEKGPPEKSGMETIEETLEKSSSFLMLGALGLGAFLAYKAFK